ncbi:2-aminomuconate deaminase [compost metagenome]
MATTIETGLPPMGQPFSWATRVGPLMFTAQGPVDARGGIAGDDIGAQARLTFENLRKSVQAAGAGLSNVAQVLIYMKEADDMRAIDEVYREFFEPPYPNRSSVVVKGFAHPTMHIEIVAYVELPA